MLILACDGTTANASIAIYSEDKALCSHTQRLHHSYSQDLLSIIEGLLLDVSLSLDKIDLFVFSKGPGAYSGMRVSACLIGALAFAQNKKILPLSSIEALAAYHYHLTGCCHMRVSISIGMQKRICARCDWNEQGWKITEQCSIYLDEMFAYDDGLPWVILGDKPDHLSCIAYNQLGDALVYLSRHRLHLSQWSYERIEFDYAGSSF